METKKTVVENLTFIAYDFSSSKAKKRINKVIEEQKMIDASLRHDNDPRDCKHLIK
ncbi:hypothetical protein P148_SR1C00001G0312 [candidate division SR1 bacterium RAAC1_SR1_1]|nr:hypothetical protein P148_SR1C00001G0312 [candidate division SR1 bacterium RAAC1_SR1_1]